MRLLIVSHSFPPAATPASLRILEFAKHLSSLGWSVDVLCPASLSYSRMDTALLKAVPDLVTVHRRYFFDVSYFHRVIKANNPINASGGGDVKPGVARRLKNFMLFPDVYCTWIPFIIAYGLELYLRKRFQIIFATGDPWSVVYGASILAKRLRLPLVSDFRELWSGHSHRSNVSHISRCKIYEARVLRRSRLVIANSPLELAALKASFTAAPAVEFISLENGFCANEVQKAAESTPYRRREIFTVFYAGSFGYRKPDAFLIAFRWLLDRYRDFANNIRFVVAGLVEERVSRLLQELKLESNVEILGFQPRARTMELIVSSDLLLSVVGTAINQTSDPTVPAKMYEYAAAGRPILLLAKPGGATQFFHGIGGYGAVADNEDSRQILLGLDALYSRFQANDLPSMCDVRVSRYTRSRIARELSGELQKILVS